MGRTLGSRNGQGHNSKHASGTKQLINGRKTSNSTQKVAANGGKANGDVFNNNNCCTESDSDRSQTNFPFDIRISGFSSLLNTVRKSTPKVQKLILDECDIILECRVCRNLFRSLPNFLTHKQSFCKNEFHPSANSGFSQFIQNSDNSYEFQYHVDESLLQAVSTSSGSSRDSSPVGNVNDLASEKNVVTTGETIKSTSVEINSRREKMSRLHKILKRFAPEIENATRTPSSFYSDIIMRRNKQLETPSSQAVSDNIHASTSTEKTVHLHIEPLEQPHQKNGVVFLKAVGCDPSNCDVSNVQVDSRRVINSDSAVLGPDGKIICVGNSEVVERIVNKVVAQVEELQDEQQRLQAELNCPECLTLFPTRKTLRMHVRAAHRNGPDQDEESPTYSKSSDVPSETNNETSTIADTEDKISSPPLKKNKPESPLENMICTDGALPQSLPLSYSNATVQIDSGATVSSPSKSVTDTRTLFLPSPKRPRGRPRKVSSHSKTVAVSSNNIFGPRSSRSSYLSDTTEALSISRLDTAFHNGSVEQLTHNDQDPPCASFTCGKCSAKFGTKSEMSMHLAHCAGVINYAFLRRPKTPENTKISIQIRRDYLKPSNSESAQGNENINNEISANVSHGHTSNNATTNFEWTRWSHDNTDSSSVNSNSASSKSLTLEECIEIAKYKFYSTSPSCSNTRNAFSSLKNKHYSYQLDPGLCDDEDADAIEDEENEDGFPGDAISSNGSSDDDGLPDDDEKHSNHEVEMDGETDRDSNVTDSGVSTTSIIRNNCSNGVAVELEAESGASETCSNKLMDHIQSPSVVREAPAVNKTRPRENGASNISQPSSK